MTNRILVFGEATEEKHLTETTTEMLGAARRLAKIGGGSVTCALLGAGVEGLAKETIAFGADKAIVADDDLLADYQGDTYVPLAERICREVDPAVVLMSLTMMGRDLMLRLAARLNTAVAMDCTDVIMDGGRLLATRPCFGGNAHAQYSFQTSPQMATVRAKAQDPLGRDDSRQGEVVKISADLNPESMRTRIVSRRKEETEGVRLEDAPVVVGGGRGLGGPEGFQPLEELAEALGATVGATRAVCDLGWYPVATQIGLTGKVVTPDIYIAVGISGASQHMSGISQVKNIVSINNDAEANIFRASRFGIVGDWKEIIPAFAQQGTRAQGPIRLDAPCEAGSHPGLPRRFLSHPCPPETQPGGVPQFDSPQRQGVCYTTIAVVSRRIGVNHRRGVAQRQSSGLQNRRSWVRIPPPLPEVLRGADLKAFGIKEVHSFEDLVDAVDHRTKALLVTPATIEELDHSWVRDRKYEGVVVGGINLSGSSLGGTRPTADPHYGDDPHFSLTYDVQITGSAWK